MYFGKSKIQDLLFNIKGEMIEVIKAIENEYYAKINEVKKLCTHKDDNGNSATYEDRWSYNNYHEICAICGKDLTSK